MTISTLDAYLAAYKQHREIFKNGTAATTVAGREHFLFDRAGHPTAGSLNPGNTTTGVVPTDATTGFFLLDAFQGSNKGYLSRVEAYNTVASSLLLFDVLFWAGQVTIPTSGTTTTTLSSQPSYASRLPFKSDGVTRDYSQTELWLLSSVAWSNHAHTASITYTDQDGNTGASTGNVSTQNRPVGSLMRMPFASGDNGVQKIESFALNGVTSAAGAVVAMVVRRLWAGRFTAGNYNVFGPDMTGMPELFADSALALAVIADSTSAGLPFVRVQVAEG